jgi:hypothetical protein
MLPASSSAAVFIIRARRKTISSLGGRAGRWGRFPVIFRVPVRVAAPSGARPRSHTISER